MDHWTKNLISTYLLNWTTGQKTEFEYVTTRFFISRTLPVKFRKNLFVTDGNFYNSFDRTLEQSDAVQYPLEFLNSLNPSGLPPHCLHDVFSYFRAKHG